MKAMILAAGFGKRLRPFTDKTPKPLYPLQGGGTLIDRHLHSLAKAGVQQVMINIAYLGNQIEQHVGNGSRYGLQVFYSREPEHAPLETGGAVAAVLPWFADEPFLLLAADIWTNYPWHNLVQSGRWVGAGRCAHLVLVPTPTWSSGPDFGWDMDSNKLLPFSDEQQGYGYAGFGVFVPKMWDGMKPGRFAVSEVIQQSLAGGTVPINASLHHGAWFNIGDVERLRELEVYCDESSNQ